MADGPNVASYAYSNMFIPIEDQVPEVLRLVGLQEKMDMFPDQLSGGEQQRVSVARAMVNRPPLDRKSVV